MVGAYAAPKKKFDPDAIVRCMLINDTRGITGNGHLGVVLVDESGYGNFYCYRRRGMYKIQFTPGQLQQFMKDGLPHKQSLFHFDRMIEWNITAEEGRRMYDCAETTQFKEFHRHASFWASVWPVKYDNCLTVARAVLTAGSRKYSFLYPFGQPNYVFYTMRMRLLLRFTPYNVYYIDGPKPEIPEDYDPLDPSTLD